MEREIKMKEAQNQGCNYADVPKSASRLDSSETFQSFNQMAVSEKKNYHCPICKEELQCTTTQNGFLYEHILRVRENYSSPFLCSNNGKYYYELRIEKRSD